MGDFVAANIWWIAPILFVFSMLCFAAAHEEECPREVMQYKCRGNACDHSPRALAEAKRIMGKDYWHGGPKV